MVDQRRLKEVRKRLLVRRRWAYLRYLNLRDAFLRTEGVLSMLAVGCGQGYAELALALEFPDVHVHLTDIAPHYDRAKQLADLWKIENATFGIRDILRPEPGRYDLVASIEVLEHIENDRWAAAEMRAAAKAYVFALVPFADKKTNTDDELRRKHREAHEHCRVGYDEGDLRQLFPDVTEMRGCYWTKGGLLWRQRLEGLSDQEIMVSQDELEQAAISGERHQIPQRRSQACGIWVLARV